MQLFSPPGKPKSALDEASSPLVFNKEIKFIFQAPDPNVQHHTWWAKHKLRLAAGWSTSFDSQRVIFVNVCSNIKLKCGLLNVLH